MEKSLYFSIHKVEMARTYSGSGFIILVHVVEMVPLL